MPHTAGYNAIYTRLTPASRASSKHHPCAVVCSRCIAVTSYSVPVVVFLSDPAICRAGGLCCCTIHACCHRYNNAAAAATAAAVMLSWAAECGPECQPLLRFIIFYAIYVNIIFYCCTAAFRVSRAEDFRRKISAVLCFCAGEALFVASATKKKCINWHTDKYDTWYDIWRHQKRKSIKTIHTTVIVPHYSHLPCTLCPQKLQAQF